MLNPLVSLFYLFLARGGRKRGNRRTGGQTKYCNPRCACAPRVNNHCQKLSNGYRVRLLHSSPKVFALQLHLIWLTVDFSFA